MPYYLSYVVNLNERSIKNQHASLALSYQAPNKLPEVVCRVGFFGSNQVRIEKDLTAEQLGPGGKLLHKTYPITQEEAEKFFKKINNDRRIGDEIVRKKQEEIDDFLKKKDATLEDIDFILLSLKFPPDMTKTMRKQTRETAVYEFLNRKGSAAQREEVSHFLSNLYAIRRKSPEFIDARNPQRQSTPGGPQYDLYRFNCKTYALSVMREVGVMDDSLSNWGIDLPKVGEGLKPLDLEKGLRWKKSIPLSKRLEKNAFANASPAEIDEINLQIRLNELGNFLEEVRPLVNDPALNSISGIDEFRLALDTKEINKALGEKTKLQRFISCENHLKQALDKFSKKVDYGIGTWLVDCFKRALNYLGGSFSLSPEHKATAITTYFDSSAQIKTPKAKGDVVKAASAKEEVELLRKSLAEGRLLIDEWLVRIRHDKEVNKQNLNEYNPEEIEAFGCLTRLNTMSQWLQDPKVANENLEKILEEKKQLDDFKESLMKRLDQLRKSQPDLKSLKDKSEPAPIIMSHDIHHLSPESPKDEEVKTELEKSSKPHP